MVKVTQGDLRRQRAEVMKLAQHRDISKKRLEELPWSTGLLDIWRDPELLSMSSQGGLFGMCMICYLPAKTAVDVQNGGDIWRRQIEPGLKAKEAGIKGAFGVKFTSPGWAMVWNMLVMTLLPPLRCFWRWQLRRKYVVEGLLITDVCVVTLCYVCATLQEAREVKVLQDPLFTAIKQIDGAHLPTSFLAPYGVPKYTAADASKALPKQVVMTTNS